MKDTAEGSDSSEIPTASSALLAGMRIMDADSWARIVNTYGPVVYRWCRLSGIDEAHAPDIVQEVFASAARGAADFKRKRDKGSFRSWLATITRSRVRDHFRRMEKQPSVAGGTDALRQLHAIEDVIDSTICGATARSAVIRRIVSAVKSEFEPNTWSAFWMTAVEGLSGAEVSTKLGISIGSVYQSKSRVLRRLRMRLSELPGEQD